MIILYKFHLIWSLLTIMTKAALPLEIWSVYFDDTLEMIKTHSNKVVQQLIHPPFDEERYIIEIQTYIDSNSYKHNRIRRMELILCEEISMDGVDSSYVFQTFSNQSIFPYEDLEFLCLQRMASVKWPNIEHNQTVIKFPENVALPFSKLKADDTFQALLLTIEYDQNYDEIQDHSGFDLYLLEEQTNVPIQAGIMAIGLVSDSRFFLPPQTNNWSMKGVCDGACLKDRIEKNSHLNIIGIIPSSNHGYLEELSVEIVDTKNRKTQEIYVYGFTNDGRVKTIELLQEPKIKSNDKMVVNCNYATHVNKTIKGGFGLNEEHCMVWLHYYPKIDLDACLSTYSLTTLMSLLDVDDINITISSFNGLEFEINDQQRQKSQIADVLSEKDEKHQWNVEKLIKAKYSALSGKQIPQCGWNPINIGLENR